MKKFSTVQEWNDRLTNFLDTQGKCGKINTTNQTLVGDEPRTGDNMTDNTNTSIQHFVKPEASLADAQQRYQAMKDFVKNILVEGVDFGVIPGAGNKPTLLKPGAEKLASFFGLSPSFELINFKEDWAGTTLGDGIPFFYYFYKCTLRKGDYFLGDADGSANSLEVKHAYRWIPAEQLPFGIDRDELEFRETVRSEFAFAIDKAEVSGQYGKPQRYWDEWRSLIENGIARKITKVSRSGKVLDAWETGSRVYRIKNRETADLLNTIQKMAQKRAFIATVLLTTNASEYFTQDIEDMDFGVIIDAPVTPASSQASQTNNKPTTKQTAPPWEEPPLDETLGEYSYVDPEDDPRDLERAQKQTSAKKPPVAPPADDGSAIGLIAEIVYDRASKIGYAANDKQAGLCAMIVRDFWPDKQIRERLVEKVVGIPSITKEDGQTKRVVAWLNWFDRNKGLDDSYTYGVGVAELMNTAYEEAIASS